MNPLQWACLSDIGRQIIRIAYGFKSRSQTMFMKHGTIAGRVGCSRATVLRWLARFIELGWLKIKKRYSHFCEYDVSSVTVTPPAPARATSQRGSSLLTTERTARASSERKRNAAEWAYLDDPSLDGLKGMARAEAQVKLLRARWAS